MAVKIEVQTKTVLIVEDEVALREILRDNLVAAGFTVLEARNGEEGHKMALDYRPDIMLLDILLPRMDGIELMRRLRKDPWGKRLPVMIVTNVSPNRKVIQGVAEGKPAFYLEKAGWSISEVVDKVRLLAFYSPLFEKKVAA